MQVSVQHSYARARADKLGTVTLWHVHVGSGLSEAVAVGLQASQACMIGAVAVLEEGGGRRTNSININNTTEDS